MFCEEDGTGSIGTVSGRDRKGRRRGSREGTTEVPNESIVTQMAKGEGTRTKGDEVSRDFNASRLSSAAVVV